MKRSDVVPVKRPFAKYITVGVAILAVAAIIFAWMDEAGMGKEFVRILESARR